MAPATQVPVKRATYDGSRPRFRSLEEWLNVYGNAEYAIYKRDATPKVLSYEDWSKSEHVLGPFLWYTTLDVWEEDSSSDEDSDLDLPALTAPNSKKQQPKKTAKTNGHGKRGGVKSSPSVAQSKPEDVAAAAKRKRKPKKPYLSEDLVVSDLSDEGDGAGPAIEVPTPLASVPNSPGNGRRKSGGRKKKQYLSAEIISPEDEDEDPIAVNSIVANTSSAHEPSAEHPDPTVAASSETSKAKQRKKPKKKSLSQAVISREDGGLGDAPADATSTPKNAAASPEGPGSSSRRGLRTRTPAQQRPYLHSAQVFGEIAVDEPEADLEPNSTPPRPKQKLRLTGLAQVSFSEAEGDRQEREDITMLEDNNDENEPMLDVNERQPPRKAHYKGKGRAWKKTSDDEDQDYKSPVKVKSSQPTRNTGRRKSAQTAEIPREGPEVEEPPKHQQRDEHGGQAVDSRAQSPTPKSGKKPRKPRKISHLSEEFVRDDSDTALDDNKTPKAKSTPSKPSETNTASPEQKVPKKRGRPRKSDQTTPVSFEKEKTDVNADSAFKASSAASASVLSANATPPAAEEHTPLAASFDALQATKQGDGDEQTMESPISAPVPIGASPTSRKMPETRKPITTSDAVITSNPDSSDAEVLPGATATRRTERALASKLQALDESGKAVTVGVAGVAEGSGVASSAPAIVHEDEDRSGNDGGAGVEKAPAETVGSDVTGAE